MLKVHVMYHRTGDYLVIMEQPWWIDIYEWLVDRICPCCGWSGWLSQRFEPIEVVVFRVWNRLLRKTLKWQKERYRVLVSNGCEASFALWPKYKHSCFRDNCDNCWHLQDDAYNSEGDLT